ncbi:MAG: hypothetical protein A3B70_07755 [Deltaproteobacteria bacterium RIFCSPHIGHO2_02_FULL_40_11]|nr:MAG: hypothetical protein A3B70_07755 [Deltaproteobacteria bacterium RIFCSPHIGHO2_02_FULL_40_11]
MKLDQIRRRVGQMFIVGFQGTTVTDDLKKLIQDYYIGGVILFRPNLESPQKIAELTNEIQSLSKTPLFVSIDQEPGQIKRLQEPFTYFCSPTELARTGSPKISFDVGYAMAREMRAVGINYDFAPVVDVNTNPQNPIIGKRAFGSDPEEVAKIATAFARGLQRGGVIACAKHFPGHGDTQKDSHKELPYVKETVEQLKSREWIPFSQCIKGGIETVMTAHIMNENIDPEFPATLSKKTLDYLRGELRFSKAIVTDDLEMKAIIDNYSIEDACMKAVGAGCDFLLICQTLVNQVKGIETILRAVLDLKIPVTRIEESSERITKIRNRYLVPFVPVDPSKIEEVVACEEHKQLAGQFKPRDE